MGEQLTTTRVDKRSSLLVLLALAGMCLAVFWPVLRHEFVFDDLQYITDNPQVNTGLTWPNALWAFRAYYAGNWHPLTWLSHMADVDMFGMNPAGHHLVNLLIHAVNAGLLFLVLSSRTQAKWQSAFVAALFAVHPLHVESVAWAAERKDLLSTFFWILTMAAYFWYAKRPTAGRYLPVVLALSLGLMSKAMLVTLPFVLLLLDYWPLGRVDTKWRLIREKAPLLVLVSASSFVTIMAQARAAGVVHLDKLPLPERLANALLSYLLYLWKTVWPFNLAVYYPHPGSTIPALALAGAVLLLSCATLLVAWKRREAPYLGVGWFWYLGTLVPVIGLVQVGKQGLADRYTYVPLIGLFIMVAWGFPVLLSRLRVPRPAVAALACSALLFLGAVARLQVVHWENPIALYAHAVAVTTNNPVMEGTLGFELSRQGRNPEAIDHLTRAIRSDPTNFFAVLSLGVALGNQGQYEPAFRALRAAQALVPEDGRPLLNIGNLYFQQGNIEQAIISFRGAIEREPGTAAFYNNLGVALMEHGESQEALRVFAHALQLAPNLVDAHLNLGQALEMIGQTPQALWHFRRALSISPTLEKARVGVERLSRVQQ